MQALEIERLRRSDMGADLDGGHVLDCSVIDAEIQLDHTSHLHMELPAGVERVQHHTSSADRAEIQRMEG